MSTTTTWLLVKLEHGGAFDEENEVLPTFCSAIAADNDLREMCNEWLPRVRVLSVYRSNGAEAILHDEELGRIILDREGLLGEESEDGT